MREGYNQEIEMGIFSSLRTMYPTIRDIAQGGINRALAVASNSRAFVRRYLAHGVFTPLVEYLYIRLIFTASTADSSWLTRAQCVE